MTATGGIDVSVIIPTKNRNEFLRRAIDSVVAQAYPSLELCVVDNNSDSGLSEGIHAMITGYRQAHPGIRWTYVHSLQPYASGVKNDGMHRVKGKYICFLDDDDQLLAGSIALRVKRMSADPGLALLYCAGYSLIYPYPFRMYRYYRYNKERDTDTLKMMSCSSMFINRELFLEKGLFFDKAISRIEDYDFCKTIIQLGLRVASIPEPLVLLHQHPHERMSTTHTALHVADFRERLVKKWGASAEEYVYHYVAGYYLWRICFGIEKKPYREIVAELQKEFNRTPSFGFLVRHWLVSLSPFLYLFVYHCMLIFWQFYRNKVTSGRKA